MNTHTQLYLQERKKHIDETVLVIDKIHFVFQILLNLKNDDN